MIKESKFNIFLIKNVRLELKRRTKKTAMFPVKHYLVRFNGYNLSQAAFISATIGTPFAYEQIIYPFLKFGKRSYKKI